mmetsp:Transcript_61445/g.168740  ORF Transcript_61445/g.168740 Transcript_61445/m.168740 type:complete len:174 (+) Transcript_61445:337-858(+)
MGVYRLSPNLMFDRPCYIKEAGVEETHYLYRTTSTAHPISLWRVTDHKHDMYEEKGFLSSKNAAELPVDSGIEWLFRSGRKGSWSLADISCFEVNDFMCAVYDADKKKLETLIGRGNGENAGNAKLDVNEEVHALGGNVRGSGWWCNIRTQNLTATNLHTKFHVDFKFVLGHC